MLRIEVNFSNPRMKAAAAGLKADAAALTELHQAMAMGLETKVRGHLHERNRRSPNTGFYGKAARSVESEWDATAGTVSVPHAGAALRLHGGRVTPKTVKNLALPTPHVPVKAGERMRPGEMKNLAYIPSRKGGVSVTTGYLVEGEEKTLTRGKRKGSSGMVPKPGGRLMFVLRGFTDHDPDPTVLPDQAAMEEAAAEGGENYLAAAARERGLT